MRVLMLLLLMTLEFRGEDTGLVQGKKDFNILYIYPLVLCTHICCFICFGGGRLRAA